MSARCGPDPVDSPNQDPPLCPPPAILPVFPLPTRPVILKANFRQIGTEFGQAILCTFSEIASECNRLSRPRRVPSSENTFIDTVENIFLPVAEAQRFAVLVFLKNAAMY